MRIQTWDSGFVRARRADVHPFFALPPEEYGQWWPGLRSQKLADGRVRWHLRSPGRWRRRHRIDVEVVKVRPDLGVNYRFSGDLVGDAEVFYLDEPSGAVIGYLLHVDSVGGNRRGRRLERQHRAVAREALNAIKDRCEAGRIAGAEPDPQLLADQIAAAAAFKAGVEAHARKMAERT